MRSEPLGLRDGDREELGRWLRSSPIKAGLAQRARIVLLGADGYSHVDVAAQVGADGPAVAAALRPLRAGRAGRRFIVSPHRE